MSETASSTIMAVIVGMAAVNFVVRYVPLALFSRLELPTPLQRWLSYVPISVMGALVAVEVVGTEGVSAELFSTAPLYASLLSMVVFRYTRSFLGASLTGMFAFVLLRAVLG